MSRFCVSLFALLVLAVVLPDASAHAQNVKLDDEPISITVVTPASMVQVWGDAQDAPQVQLADTQTSWIVDRTESTRSFTLMY